MNPAQMMDGPPDWDREREIYRQANIAAREQASADAEIITDRGAWDRRVDERAKRILAEVMERNGSYDSGTVCRIAAESWFTAVDMARREAACQLKQEDRDAR